MTGRRNVVRTAVTVASTTALALALVLTHGWRAFAHEIPADVTIVAFVKPEGERMRLLVRVPLAAIRDVEFPVYGPGYLDLAALRPMLPAAAKLWIADYVALHEDGRALGEEQIVSTRVSLPSDPSFVAWSSALAHLTGPPLSATTEIVWDQALLDVLMDVPIASPESRFAIDPAWAHLGLRTVTILRFVSADDRERLFRYEGDPGLVRLDPRWHQAAALFIESGFLHILEGLDHLLFLLCLVIPFRRLRALVPIVTAFTVAHSITLIASASGLAPDGLWFPPLIETLIAASIVWMAFENIVVAWRRSGTSGPAGDGRDRNDDNRGSTRLWLERRWIVAFGFGLVHGFGFSFLLRESLQFAGSHLTLSLVSFNIGVELGQLAVLLLMVPALDLLFRTVRDERIGAILLSALVAHTAWHWTTARGSALLAYDFVWPAFDVLLLATAMRWLMLLLIAVGAAWLLSLLFGGRGRWGAGVRGARLES